MFFNRWKMQHGHPAFAWGGEPSGPDEGGGQWAQHGGPPWAHHGPPWGHHGPPPWAHRGGPPFGPQGGWWMRRGFPGGPGRGPGGPPAFGRGDLKYQLLALLTEGPKHGYEMIKALETQSGGFYTPSAGAVYPSLQLMEDQGWIASQAQEGKKVYTISDAGRQALAEHQQTAEQFGRPWGWGHHHRHGGAFGPQAQPELTALWHEGREIAPLLWAAVRVASGDPAQLARLRGILTNTRSQLEAFLGQPGPGADTTRLDPQRGPDPDATPPDRARGPGESGNE